jgi:hypothetical protein
MTGGSNRMADNELELLLLMVGPGAAASLFCARKFAEIVPSGA